MQGYFFTMVVISPKRKTAAFGKTRYVVRIAEHRIKFSFGSRKFWQKCCY